ncbi:MAG: hypothetical protein WA005_04625 [Candidatus Binataceae bacterium]
MQNYFSNANTTGGQAFVNITAPLEGNETATNPAVEQGETCAMIYVFNTDEAMAACCGCPLPIAAAAPANARSAGSILPTPSAP